ncbi:MAG: amino acid adenylation domain-containing protein [Arenibacter latericius]|nr:amino acid adenylation domain-containing protein [Arenibacter latericius]
MNNKIIEYIKTEIAMAPLDDLGPKENLLESGIIDSIGMAKLIEFLEAEFEIKVPAEDMNMENFMSIESIVQYISNKRSHNKLQNQISNTLLDLSQAQMSLWVGQQLNPDVPLHNTAYAFKINGALNVDTFKTAFYKVISQIDAFKTIFLVGNNGEPKQTVLQRMDYDLEVVEFPADTPSNIVEEWLQQWSLRPIDISKCVFDSVLLNLGEEKYIWMLNMHHLVTDAVSMALIYDLTQKYYGNIKTDNWEMIIDSPSFQNYIQYEILEQENPKNDNSKAYWANKVKELKAVPKLYGVHNNFTNTESSRVVLPLGAERSQKLRKLSQQPEIRGWTTHVTLFNIFLTILYSYLYRVSGQKKLAIGVPNHNRMTKQFQQTVGYFIQFFPMVTEIEEEDTFITLLNKVKLETNDYLKNAISGLVTPDINKSFHTILNYIPNSFPAFDGIPQKTKWIFNNHMETTHNLRCHVTDFNNTEEFEILMDFNHAVFYADLISNAPTHFLNLIDAFLEDYYQPLDKPGLISEKEKKELIGNPIKPLEGYRPIILQFSETATSNSNQTALHYKNELYTYADVDQKSNQLAAFLITKGIKEGKRVALYMDRSPEYIIAVLAVLKTGGTFIPIPSDQPTQRIGYILENSEAHLILSNSQLQPKLPDTSVETIILDKNAGYLKQQKKEIGNIVIPSKSIAYILYTSGSTGNPKGVLISHGALTNYMEWAKEAYALGDKFVFPLFTSIGFDLTITSTFLPLITGGELVIYKESLSGPDISIMEVLQENKVNSIKLTPSHLALLQGMDLSNSIIRLMIVGGEDLKTALARSIQNGFGNQLRLFNEYGPTEATVGCIVAQYDKAKHLGSSVPIGYPIYNMDVYILDARHNLVPNGVTGEIYLSGASLAEGYVNSPRMTEEKFGPNPFVKGTRMYRTGDLARKNSSGDLEYLGRVDEQVKLRGFRIELSDIEANMMKHQGIQNAAVVLIEEDKPIPENEVINCTACGLPSNYPNVDFDENGVCHICNAFKGYKQQAQRYFKTENELRDLLTSKRGNSPNYDCISLLSGGKDSTYVLAKLIELGLKVLAFTLDNGYISDQAKQNVDKIVTKLGVDHIYGNTPHMNRIFVDSLHRHKNVCNGCFKTIYTLSSKIALEKQIPFVVTGLSRGQFFETRLTEELFWDKNVDVATIDRTILEARKLYHQEEDAVKYLLDVDVFSKNETFEKVQFVDYYRYSDVSLEEMLVFLKEKVGWVRPTDTGRSTNCLINQVGIYVHKKQKGYSNYSFPYSWDVRMGHKTRTETLEEINEYIDETTVKRIMDEIGYQEPNESEMGKKRLMAYYSGDQILGSKELSTHLMNELPDYMVPTHFKYMKELPLTGNGKVDKRVLRELNSSQLEMDVPYIAPEGEIEELLAGIWREVLNLKQVGSQDDFIALGGHSLAAIRVTARINEEVEMNFPLNKIFELPTIAEYAKYIEKTLLTLMEE